MKTGFWGLGLLGLVALGFWQCGGGRETPVAKVYTSPQDPRLVHHTVAQVTEVIVYDVFSPPVASRIYAYTSLAMYECLRHARAGTPPLAGRLNGFGPLPAPPAGQVDYAAAAVKAAVTVADKVTFSKDSLFAFEKTVYRELAALGVPDSVLARSQAFGEAVGRAILARAAQDNYQPTRGMPRFTVVKKPGLWVPTSPDYADAVEPHWAKMQPLALDSASQCQPPRPLAFSADKKSPFYQQVYEVYELKPQLTKDQEEIAYFWDDNPAVSEHKGHSMVLAKKMTPAGHWMAIAGLVAQQQDQDQLATAQAYALTAIALYDGFISCWDEKYRSVLVRPITVINEWLDPKWEPFLQTPAFPEYSSGHGVISAASATVLTALLGDQVAFRDTSEVPYGRPVRQFGSFQQAAAEASLSRVYGGIHYRFTSTASTTQGERVGQQIVARLGAAAKLPTGK
jgi:hypothetical protein